MTQKQNLGKWIIVTIIIFCLTSVIFVFILFTKEVLYIYPATGQTKNEILGQFGDYFGGVLNPIVGIISVILLWLAYNAQREELKKTSAALAEQIALSRDENSRIQIVEMLNSEYNQHDKIFCYSFKIEMSPPDKSDLLIFIFEQGKTYTLTQLIEIFDRMYKRCDFSDEILYADIINDMFINYDPTQPETYFSTIWNIIFEAKNNINRIHNLSMDLVKVTHLENIERIWINRFYDALFKCKNVGVLSDIEQDEMIVEYHNFKNRKFDKSEMAIEK